MAKRRLFRAVIEVDDQNSIMMKDVDIVSQNDWLGEKGEENNEDKGEVYMSQATRELVLEVENIELTVKTSQEAEGQ